MRETGEVIPEFVDYCPEAVLDELEPGGRRPPVAEGSPSGDRRLIGEQAEL